MINLEEIDKAILELEQHDTTFATCEKLACLYTVKDHIAGTGQAAKSMPQINGSEFLDACAGADMVNVLNVLNEHMDAIKALYPREYSVIIKKLNA